MTQKERIIDYILEFGSITSLQAFQDLGCTRLASRICDLRKDGYIFDKKYVKSKNRYGEDTVYVEYSLSGYPHGI